MGEKNDASMELITRALGQPPRTTWNADGTMSLHLGEVVLTAPPAMRGDPTAFLHDDGTLTVSWGRSRVTLPVTPDAV